jgi:hypothetical protein
VDNVGLTLSIGLIIEGFNKITIPNIRAAEAKQVEKPIKIGLI